MSAEQPDAAQIAAALGGRLRGRQAMVRCPAHADGTPSLHITVGRDGTVLLKCFGGCENGALIRTLRDMGLWPDREERRSANSPHRTVDLRAVPSEPDEDDTRRMEHARRIWAESKPIAGTLAEVYLRGRAITRWLPPTLRFHPNLQHVAHGTLAKSWHPALVCAVQDGTSAVTAVQRIYLRSDGSAARHLEPRKAALGPMYDGAVRLGRAGKLMGIAEAVETGLSAAEIYSIPVWATLGAGRLKSVALPEECEQLVIFADNGEVGQRLAREAVPEYERRRIEAFVESPPEEFDDFNTQHQARAKAKVAA